MDFRLIIEPARTEMLICGSVVRFVECAVLGSGGRFHVGRRVLVPCVRTRYIKMYCFYADVLPNFCIRLNADVLSFVTVSSLRACISAGSTKDHFLGRSVTYQGQVYLDARGSLPQLSHPSRTFDLTDIRGFYYATFGS